MKYFINSFIYLHFFSYILSSSITLKSKLNSNNTSTPFTGPFYLTTTLRLTKTLSIPLTLDTTSTSSFISSQNTHPRGLNHLDSFLESTHRGYNLVLNTGHSIQSISYKTSPYFSKATDPLSVPFEFYLIHSINYNMSQCNFIGTLGLCASPSHSKDALSFVNTLYMNHLISCRSLAFVFTSNNDINVHIGDSSFIQNVNSFVYCDVPSFPREYCMYCSLEKVKCGYDEYNSTHNVVFNLRDNRFEAPFDDGYAVIRMFKDIAGDDCVIREIDEINSMYLDCKETYDVNAFPEVKLIFKGERNVNVVLKPVDLFDNTGKGLLYARKYINSWMLGLRVMKYYNMYVEFDTGKIGFRENGIFNNTDNKYKRISPTIKLLLTWITLILLLLGCIILFITSNYL